METNLYFYRQAVRIVHGSCFYCGGHPESADHIIGRAFDGDDTPDNLIASCRKCNSAKARVRLPEEVESAALVAAAKVVPSALEVSRYLEYLANGSKPLARMLGRFGDVTDSRLVSMRNLVVGCRSAMGVDYFDAAFPSVAKALVTD